MARNERPAYPEWLAHHRRQGVQHFYIIDNNSSDGSVTNFLAHEEDITVFSWMHRSTDRNTDNTSSSKSLSNQVRAYNFFLPNVTSEWVGIIDLDEFAFGINTTLARFLRQLTPAKQQVCLPWIIFGSSNLTVQPACVTEANVRRRGNVEREGKCFMRTRRILSAEIHRTVMHNETYHRRGEGCVCGDGRRCNCCGHTGPSPAFACHSSLSPLRSSQASTPHLRLHHYISQSREHMLARSSVGEAGAPFPPRPPLTSPPHPPLALPLALPAHPPMDLPSARPPRSLDVLDQTSTSGRGATPTGTASRRLAMACSISAWRSGLYAAQGRQRIRAVDLIGRATLGTESSTLLQPSRNKRRSSWRRQSIFRSTARLLSLGLD